MPTTEGASEEIAGASGLYPSAAGTEVDEEVVLETAEALVTLEVEAVVGAEERDMMEGRATSSTTTGSKP